SSRTGMLRPSGPAPHSSYTTSLDATLLRLGEDRRRSADLRDLRCVIHSGAPCPIAVKERILHWWGDIVWEVYGTTEGTATFASAQDWRARPGTQGRPLPGGDVAVLASDGSPCPPGVSGQVFIKSPPQLPPFEYLNDPTRTRANRRDDYFTVGDLGHVDDEGWLFLTGRAADIINVAGLNVYGAEVEEVIARHPAVLGVAVIGVPSTQTGEEVKAIVELEAGHVPVPRLTAEIAAMCRQSLASHKWPASIDYRPQLPRDERGKLRREELRSEYLEEPEQGPFQAPN
ncbi:MAG: AMP-binding protein, partial [Acidimicrobiia bacterium]